MSYAEYTPYETVDEMADYTQMMGPASAQNQAMGNKGFFRTPTGSLVGLWIVALVLLWVIGSVFRGARQ